MLQLIFVALFQTVGGEPAAPAPSAEGAPGVTEPADSTTTPEDPAAVAAEDAAEAVEETAAESAPQMITRTRRVCVSEEAFVGTRMNRRRCRNVTETVPVEEAAAEETTRE